MCAFFSSSKEEYDTLLPFICDEILRTHPAAIIGGVLHHNPFFAPPQADRASMRVGTPEAGRQDILH